MAAATLASGTRRQPVGKTQDYPDVDSRVALLALMAVLPARPGPTPEPAVPPVATLIATLRLSSFVVVAGFKEYQRGHD